MEEYLISAIEACEHARQPSRNLDAQIALAVFPALADLRRSADGTWLDAEGKRIQALRYSTSYKAATTLVPAGCWIEEDGGQYTIIGAEGSWSGSHPVNAIALCLAALRARKVCDFSAS